MKKRRPVTVDERLAALAASLADPTTTWGAVIDRLARWPATPEREQALAMVAAAADRWPARGLSRLAFQQLLAGDVRPYLRLVRTLDFARLWQVRDRPALLERMVAEGGLRVLDAFSTRYSDGEALISTLVRHIAGLRHLYLGTCRIGNAGAVALAGAPALATLRHLSLHSNDLDDDGAAALLESPHLGGLRFLNLYGNRLTAEMVERVRAAPAWQQTRIILHGQRA